MCRLLAYVGEPIFLETLLVKKETSLIAQSLAAREAKTIVNGDGCGLGWYSAHKTPGLYRSTLPAWSDANLLSLCQQIKAPLFIGHVRAATSGEVSQSNCHPFAHENHLFAHNGQIGDYDTLRRKIDALIPDEVFGMRRGTGDSEALFLSALGRGLEQDPIRAFEKTLADTMAIVCRAPDCQPVRFASVYADGNCLWAFRWASDDKAPSLYWRQLEGGIVIASEPFDPGHPDWNVVPAQSAVHICQAGKVHERAMTV